MIDINEPMATEYVHSATFTLNYGVTDGGSGVKTVSPTLNDAPTFAGTDLLSGESINLLTALPLGVHNFTVNADDQVDNFSDTASVDFSIIVTPESIIDALKQFEASGDIDRHLVNSLNVKLRTARGKRSQQQCKTSNKMYGAFINELRAQSGKKVTVFAADILITDAIYLIDNCYGNR